MNTDQTFEPCDTVRLARPLLADVEGVRLPDLDTLLVVEEVFGDRFPGLVQVVAWSARRDPEAQEWRLQARDLVAAS